MQLLQVRFRLFRAFWFFKQKQVLKRQGGTSARIVAARHHGLQCR